MSEQQLKEKITALENKLKSIKASALMTKKVSTTSPGANLAEVADLMIKERISGMPVLGREGKMIGIVTTTDLLIVMGMISDGSAVDRGESTINPTVEFAMSSDIYTVNENTGLDDVMHLMREKSIHTIPVMKDDQIVGVIGRHDVLKKFYEVVKTLSV